MTWDHSAISEKFSGSLRGSRDAPRFGGPTAVQRRPIGDVPPPPHEISTHTREGRGEVGRRRELAPPVTGYAGPPRTPAAAESFRSHRPIPRRKPLRESARSLPLPSGVTDAA